MISHHHHSEANWIDLAAPKKKEIREVIEEYSLPLRFGEILQEPTRQSTLIQSEGKMLFTLHFPTYGKQKTNEDERRAVTFVLGDGFLLTCHCKPMDVLDKFAKTLEADALVGKTNERNQNELLLCEIIEALYDRLEDELEGIEDRLEESEDKVFGGGEKRMVYTLSKINKDLLDFKQAIRLHQNFFEKFHHLAPSSISQTLEKNMPKIATQYQNIWSTILAHRETLQELRGTNDSLLSAKTNRIMKVLTIITFATYPSIFITGLFGMNTTNPPIIGEVGDFWMILGVIFITTILILSFFVHKRWF